MDTNVENLFKKANEARKNVSGENIEWKALRDFIEDNGLADEFCDYVNKVEGKTIYMRFTIAN